VAAITRRKANASGGVSYYDEVTADAPVAYWRLGEASGTTAADDTANNYDGTYVGSPTLGVTGAVAGNTSVTFNVAQYAEATGVEDLVTDWTIEAWVKPASGGGSSGRTIYSRWASNAAGRQISIYIRASDNKIQVDVPFVVAVLTGATALSDGTWYHVAVTRSGNLFTIYIDGVSDASATVSASQESNGVVRLGRPESAASADEFSFSGTLDEVAIYDAALSGARIAAHYDAA
jgi:hypothetical protein